MTTAIALAGPADLERVLSLATRYHEEAGLTLDEQQRENAIDPLLQGSPLGAVWLIGPNRAPLGYVLVTFGWSVAFGGMTGWLAEAYIRPSVRRRGIGTEVVHAIALNLREAGLKALHADVTDKTEAAARFCSRAGFRDSRAATVLTDRL